MGSKQRLDSYLAEQNRTEPNLLKPSDDNTDKMNVRPAKTQWVAKFVRTAKTLIRLGGCPGWSESSLGAQPLLVLSRGGSFDGKQGNAAE